MPGLHPAFCPILALSFAAAVPAQGWLPASPDPDWGAAPPRDVVTIAFDAGQSPAANGTRLHVAIQALRPGQGLAIGPGTWSITNRLDLAGVGTPQAPFWLFAADPARKPVITRPNANQNAVNVGSNGPARYWVLRDLEITGGADLLKLYDCSHLWLDRCYLHDGGGVGVSAQMRSNDHLYLTRNEIARPGPGTTGEGMYLGAGTSAVCTSWSVVAYNHVHGTRGAQSAQGDGIEVKQGSHHNWVLGNVVHDCRNPCILVYGTGGDGENVVDGNLLYDSDDVVLQVQGEAVVRNNVVIGGSVGFSSHDHQGQSRDLRFVHNTVVNHGRAAALAAWSGRPGMVFANNVVYSLGAEAVFFGNGSAGVQLAGNVVVGRVVNAAGGWSAGAGLQDFSDVTLDTFHHDVTPVAGGAIDNRGSPAFAVATDRLAAPRALPVDPGAVTNAATLHSPTAVIPLATGGSQELTFAAPGLAGAAYQLLGSAGGTAPGSALGGFTLPLVADGWLLATLQAPNTGMLRNSAGTLDAGGRAVATLALPPLPAALHGVVLHHALVAVRGSAVAFVSNPVAVTLE